MSLKIITDSTCDLPAETIKQHGIEVLPLHIQMGDESLIDGVDISKDEFYKRLPNYDPSPSTAAPGPEAFIKRFEALAEQGAKAILSIHISESLSATVNSARLAAKQFTRVPVTVLDSGQLSMGLGFLVEKAAQLAAAGQRVEEIVNALSDLMARTYVFAALDTLEYLRRSGRMHIMVARFGELLRLKPMLHMNQGNPKAYRTRTTGRAMARMFSWLEEYGPLERLAIVHAGVIDRAEAVRDQVSHFFPDDEIPILQITPVLGANLGIGALGFACISKKD